MERAPSTKPTGISSRAQAVAGALALVGITVALFGFLTHRGFQTAVESRVREQLTTLSIGTSLELQRPLANHSAAEIERIAAAAFTHRLVTSVKVTDELGRTAALRLREDPALIDDARLLALSAAPPELRTASEVVVAGRRLGWSCRTPIWSQHQPARLLGYVTISGSDGAEMLVAKAIPKTAIMAGTASLLLAAPFAVWAASSFTRPLRRIAAATIDLKEGKEPEPITARGPRETRQLASAFNDMNLSLSAARERLERANAELEEKVELRTQQLQLINSALENQITLKNDFLRSVSHDLGAPLRNIAGMTALILEDHADQLPEESVHRLQRITANVEIEANMLTELLDLSRTADRTENITDVPLADIAAELAQSLSHDLTKKEIKLAIEPDLPTLRVDRTDLWMLLQNLTDNALKYMGDAATRRVTISPITKDQSTTGFAITDTGPGIPEHEQASAFQVFQRASTSKGSKGSGVGLSVVRAIVDRWAADITLISSEGKGTRFEIHLPAGRLSTRTNRTDQTHSRSG